MTSVDSKQKKHNSFGKEEEWYQNKKEPRRDKEIKAEITKKNRLRLVIT